MIILSMYYCGQLKVIHLPQLRRTGVQVPAHGPRQCAHPRVWARYFVLHLPYQVLCEIYPPNRPFIQLSMRIYQYMLKSPPDGTMKDIN